MTRWVIGLAIMLGALTARGAVVFDYSTGQPGSVAPRRPVGSPAPDMTLPLRQSYLDVENKATAETVRLSAFIGKKPVVLFLTGYT